MEAARHGRGIALTNVLIAASDLTAGRLVEVGKDNASFKPPLVGIYHFITKADRWDSATIRRFRQWLAAAIIKEHPQFKPLTTA